MYQTELIAARGNKEEVPVINEPLQLPSPKSKVNQLIKFLRQLNPLTWFNDFGTIEITMEEHF